jgi:hypothetical protein
MFRLHETTRRRVCRWAFVLLCAGPTLATLAWIAHQRRPWRVGDEQARLAGSLQAHIRLADWRAPRPGTIRTAELQITEPSTRQSLVAVRGLEVRSSRGVRTLSAKGVVLSVDQLRSLARRIPGWIAGSEEREVRVRFEALSIAAADGGPAIQFYGVEAIVRRSGSGCEAQLLARRVADAAVSERLRVTTTWSDPVSDEPGRWTAKADCSQAALPAWLLSKVAPIGDDWGAAASFAGMVQLEGADDTTTGVASGQLLGIDVAACTAAGNLETHGQADVQIDELHWQGDRVEHASGVVHANNLTIHPPVLAAAVSSLYCGVQEVASDSNGASPAAITVDRLACQFQLDGVVLVLSGAFPTSEAPANCLALAGGRPLVTTPWHPSLEPGESLRLHASAWLQFLGSGVRGWVPASRQAVEAAGRLQLPEAVPPAVDAPPAS